MNERIRELAEQAGGEFWQRLENDVVKQDAYITFDPPETLEKFAELIVRECASIVEGSPWNLPRGYKAVDQAELVKKHFGVE